MKEWVLFAPQNDNNSRSWLRTHFRSILLGIILITLPFYCLGFILWGLSPSSGESQRIETVPFTATIIDEEASPTPSTTPQEPTATPSPTVTPSPLPPSATPFRIPQQPPTSLPFNPPSVVPATATDYPLPEGTPTHTREPLLPATNTPNP